MQYFKELFRQPLYVEPVRHPNSLTVAHSYAPHLEHGLAPLEPAAPEEVRVTVCPAHEIFTDHIEEMDAGPSGSWLSSSSGGTGGPAAPAPARQPRPLPGPMVRYGMQIEGQTADNLRHMQALLNQWLRQGYAPPELAAHLKAMRRTAIDLISIGQGPGQLYEDLFHITLQLNQALSVVRAAVDHQQQLTEIWTEPNVCDRLTAQTELFNGRLQGVMAAVALSRDTARCAVAVTSALSYSFYGEAPMDLRPGLGHHPKSLYALHRATKELMRALARLRGDLDGWRQDMGLHAAKLQVARPHTLAPRPVDDARRPAQPLEPQTGAHMHCIAVCYEDQIRASAELLEMMDHLGRYLAHCTERIKDSWNSASIKDQRPL